MPSQGRTTSLPLEEKLQIYLKAQRDLKTKDGELLLWAFSTFKKTVSIRTIRRIRNQQPSYFCSANLSATRRRRVKFPELEQQLVNCFHRHEQNAITSDDILLVKDGDIKKSLNIGDDQLRLSNGWLSKFKKRNGISSKRLHGEAGSASAVVVRPARYSLQDITRHYRPEDIYNFDETALFYRLAPNQTLATKSLKGKKRDKARVTIAFCFNATGTHKLDPLVIGTAANPRCFQGGTRRALKGKSVVYYYTKKAWMTAIIFFEWLQSFNLKMAVENRKVVLLIDNASSHKVIKPLSRVDVHFLPRNLPSSVQPLDAGIIRSFKARYRRRFVRWCLDAVEGDIKRKLNLLDAIQFSIDSWGDVTADCIRNSWVKSRIVDATLLGELRQAGEYALAAEERVVNDIVSMLEEVSAHDSVAHYLEIDSDVEVHELPDGDAKDDDAEEVDGDVDDENDKTPVSASTALAHCMELSSFLFQCEGDTKQELEMIQTLTMVARAQVVKRADITGNLFYTNVNVAISISDTFSK